MGLQVPDATDRGLPPVLPNKKSEKDFKAAVTTASSGEKKKSEKQTNNGNNPGNAAAPGYAGGDAQKKPEKQANNGNNPGNAAAPGYAGGEAQKKPEKPEVSHLTQLNGSSAQARSGGGGSNLPAEAGANAVTLSGPAISTDAASLQAGSGISSGQTATLTGSVHEPVTIGGKVVPRPAWMPDAWAVGLTTGSLINLFAKGGAWVLAPASPQPSSSWTDFTNKDGTPSNTAFFSKQFTPFPAITLKGLGFNLSAVSTWNGAKGMESGIGGAAPINVLGLPGVLFANARGANLDSSGQLIIPQEGAYTLSLNIGVAVNANIMLAKGLNLTAAGAAAVAGFAPETIPVTGPIAAGATSSAAGLVAANKFASGYIGAAYRVEARYQDGVFQGYYYHGQKIEPEKLAEMGMEAVKAQFFEPVTPQVAMETAKERREQFAQFQEEAKATVANEREVIAAAHRELEKLPPDHADRQIYENIIRKSETVIAEQSAYETMYAGEVLSLDGTIKALEEQINGKPWDIPARGPR